MVQNEEMKKGGGGSCSAENVKVVVRCRPMSQQEVANGSAR